MDTSDDYDDRIEEDQFLNLFIWVNKIARNSDYMAPRFIDERF